LGDCLRIMPFIPDNSIDLVVTSPPYNIGIDYGTYKDNLPWGDYLNWCNKWIGQIYRILKGDGRFVLNILTNISFSRIREQPLLDFGNLIRKSNLKIHGIGFWIDINRPTYTTWGSWQSASCPYIYNPYEAIIFCYKKQWKKFKKGKDTISKENFIKGVKGIYDFGTASDKICPAVFPLKLPMLFVELLSYENDIVLDPFIGSGTTAVVCKRYKRRYIGIEIDEKIHQIAKQRVDAIPGLLF